MDQSSGNGNGATLRTLERGLDLLTAVAESEGQVTAKALSRQLDLKLSTCYHLLRTLRENDYVSRLPGGAFGLGPRAIALGRRLQLSAGAAPEMLAILTRLRNKTNETSYVCGWYHGVITLQEYITGTHQLSVGGLDVGYSGNMYARASCRAMLAHLPTETIAMMFSGVPLERLTEHTIVDFDALLAELADVRCRGYAIDREEFVDGVCCIAAPFFTSDQQPAGAFTVSVPVSRFDAGMSHLAVDVCDAAAMASRVLATGRLTVPTGPPCTPTGRRQNRRTSA